MRAGRRRAGAALVAVLLLAGCGGGEDPVADIELDGSARTPDAEGLVEDVSLEDIRVDGKRYELSKNLLAFSTYTLAAMPVLATEGNYVHVGTKEGKAVWVAQVAKPLRTSADALLVYEGTIRRVQGDRVEFGDGTVLRAGKQVAVPAVGSRIQVELDPDTDRIKAVLGG